MTNPATTPPSADALTALLEATSRLVQANQQESHKLDALTDQIGHLSEVLITGFVQVQQRFSVIDARLDRITQSIDRQEQNISRLAATVERQSLIVERLLERE